jgi:hypothetical protein
MRTLSGANTRAPRQEASSVPTINTPITAFQRLAETASQTTTTSAVSANPERGEPMSTPSANGQFVQFVLPISGPSCPAFTALKRHERTFVGVLAKVG